MYLICIFQLWVLFLFKASVTLATISCCSEQNRHRYHGQLVHESVQIALTRHEHVLSYRLGPSIPRRKREIQSRFSKTWRNRIGTDWEWGVGGTANFIWINEQQFFLFPVMFFSLPSLNVLVFILSPLKTKRFAERVEVNAFSVFQGWTI